MVRWLCHTQRQLIFDTTAPVDPEGYKSILHMDCAKSSNDVAPKRNRPTRRNRQLRHPEEIKNSRTRDINISGEPEMLSGFAIMFNFRYPIRGSDIAGPRIELIHILAREICGS